MFYLLGVIFMYVYRYWISKQDNKLHKERCKVDTLRKDSTLFYCIHGDASEFISEYDFKNKMLKRSIGQSIYLYEENDALAKKHYIWAYNEKISKLTEDLNRYKKVRAKLLQDS